MMNGTSTDPTIRELPLAPGGEVEILLTSNRLRLGGADTDRIVIRTRDGDPVNEVVTVDGDRDHVRIRDGGDGDLRIGPLRIGMRRGTDLDVEIPRSASVSVRSLSGDLEAHGIGGSSRWATTSGDVRLAVVGGPISIESMSGDITLDVTAAVGVSARTVSGDLRIRAAQLTGLNASTTSGDVAIDAAFEEGASHAISSISGDVRVATGSPIRLETQSVTGDVRAFVPHRAEGGRGHRTVVVGDGRVRLAVRTMSGDVSVHPAGTGSGVTPEGHHASSAPVPPAAPAAPGVPEPPLEPAVGSAGQADPLVVVAEPSAAPNLVRPAARPLDTVADEAAAGGDAGPLERRDQARLEVLRALERGDLDVDGASRRLAALEQAGPRSFRGWC